ncbi:hypothetical protein Taro_052561 [Colocasia esculenta]|uniref:Uncharacterized protein n=1 Tax=Colocasia esculenta TaxID=4460 RepID=A0A843XKG5_COLES|nr:hypothetical protein [Colocasia esculenta]
MDRQREGHLLPLFVCFDLCKPSSWSRPKFFWVFGRDLNRAQAGGRDSRAWYHVTQERRNPMKSICAPGRDLGIDQSTSRVGLRAAWEFGSL